MGHGKITDVTPNLIGFYAAVATLVPLLFIALVFQSGEFKRLGRLNALGGMVAVFLLVASEIVSLASLASGKSSSIRLGLGFAASYLGAGFVAFPLIDRIVETWITTDGNVRTSREFRRQFRLLQRVARIVYVLAMPALVLWAVKFG